MIAALLVAAAIPPVETAERAFAAAAQTEGQWSAFRQFAAPDATMMIEGPQPAAPFLKDRKNPAQAVMWWPAHTITSCDQRLAFSTGPWMRNDGKSSGRYFTIWRHDESGWRWVYDGGADTPEPMAAGESVKAVQAACGPGVPISPPPPGIAAGGGSRDGSLKWFLVDIGSGKFELNVLYRFGDHAWNTERAVIG